MKVKLNNCNPENGKYDLVVWEVSCHTFEIDEASWVIIDGEKKFMHDCDCGIFRKVEQGKRCLDWECVGSRLTIES